MPAVLMTNPPGLALAVIGNPPRGTTNRRGKDMRLNRAILQPCLNY